MSLRNPIAKGTTQVMATTLIGLLPQRWRLTYKVDHPMEGDPQHYFMLTGPGSLPPTVHRHIMENPSWTSFLWVTKGLTEFTLDFDPLTMDISAHAAFMSLEQLIRQEIEP